MEPSAKIWEPKRLLQSFRVLLYVGIVFFAWQAVLQYSEMYFASGLKLGKGSLQTHRAMAYDIQHRDESFGIIFGLSSGVDGFDLPQLTRTTGYPWSNFSVRGGSYRTMELSSQPLNSVSRKFKVCVIACHPMVLARPTKLDQDEEMRRRIGAQLEIWARAVQEEGYVAGVDIKADKTPDGLFGRGTRHNCNHQLNGWRDKGFLLPERYSKRSLQFVALQKLLHRMSQLSDRLIIVKMPESAIVRQTIPPEADELFQSLVEGYEVLDLNDQLPSEDFYDHVHPNEKGRVKVTQSLLQQLDRESTKESSSP